MRVAWKDLNFTMDVGLHPVGDRWISLRPREIDIWHKHPTAIFDATCFAAPKGEDQYLLDSYEVPEP
jgi:hypothetical protein